MNLPVLILPEDLSGDRCNDRTCPIAKASLRAAKAAELPIDDCSAGLVWITLIAAGKALYRSKIPDAAFDFIWHWDQGEEPACVGFCLELFSAG